MAKISTHHISALTRKSLDDGLSALTSDKRTSNNRYMNPKEEPEFLEQFIEAAGNGQHVTVAEMHEAYQKRLARRRTNQVFITC